MDSKIITPYLNYNNINKLVTRYISGQSIMPNDLIVDSDIKVNILKNWSVITKLSNRFLYSGDVTYKDLLLCYVFVILKYFGYYLVISDGYMIINERVFITTRNIVSDVYCHLSF